MPDEKHKLTDRLKKIETVIYEKKIDLNSLNTKLQSSYDYEEELNQRMIWAKEQTEKHRLEFIKKSKEISDQYKEMKNILDVFTGNFYSN